MPLATPGVLLAANAEACQNNISSILLHGMPLPPAVLPKNCRLLVNPLQCSKRTPFCALVCDLQMDFHGSVSPLCLQIAHSGADE